LLETGWHHKPRAFLIFEREECSRKHAQESERSNEQKCFVGIMKERKILALDVLRLGTIEVLMQGKIFRHVDWGLHVQSCSPDIPRRRKLCDPDAASDAVSEQCSLSLLQ
jgi:hypothetical protein